MADRPLGSPGAKVPDHVKELNRAPRTIDEQLDQQLRVPSNSYMVRTITTVHTDPTVPVTREVIVGLQDSSGSHFGEIPLDAAEELTPELITQLRAQAKKHRDKVNNKLKDKAKLEQLRANKK